MSSNATRADGPGPRRIERRPSLFSYAVVDLASAPSLTHLVTGRMSHEARPLLAPDLPVELLAVGPWLADLARLPDLGRAIDLLEPDVPWGYCLHASVDIVSVRRALRRFNLVELPGSRRSVLFRYWDPRVMKTFLDVATRDQKALLFEFIDRIEGPAGSFEAWYPGR